MIRPPDPGDGRPAGGEGPKDARAMARELLRSMIEANPDATPDELNAALAEHMENHNRASQRELCGLSPDQVQRLLGDPWDGTGPLRLDEALPLEAIEDAPLLATARELLAFLQEVDGVRATAAGNLNRAAVAALLERLSGFDIVLQILRRELRVINEADAVPLFRLRILLGAAGLLRRHRGRFLITRRGHALLAPERAGELFALLFRTIFRELNLAAFDMMSDAPGFQYTVSVMLERFQRLRPRWWHTTELATRIVLPPVRDEVPVLVIGEPPDAHEVDQLPALIEHRLLEWLHDLGLVHVRKLPDDHPLRPRRVYRKAPLLDRFVRWELEG